MHICVTNRTVGREDDLLRDLAIAVKETRSDPSSADKVIFTVLFVFLVFVFLFFSLLHAVVVFMFLIFLS
jgi:hypothetical protein